MTDTRNAPPAAMPDGPRKAILAVMGLSLLVMLGGSFLYRLNHPGLVVEGRQQPPAATQGPSEAEVLGPMMQRLQQNPNDLEALVFLGEHFLGHEDWARAEAFLQRAVIAAPTEGRPLYLLGIAQYHREQFAPAAETFERLLAINDEPAARYNLGLLYLHYLNDKPRPCNTSRPSSQPRTPLRNSASARARNSPRPPATDNQTDQDSTTGSGKTLPVVYAITFP